MKKVNTTFEHFDHLGQPIKVGNYVSFTWSNHCGVHVGIITKLTEKRVRLNWNSSYTRNGVKTFYTGNRVVRPTDCLVLSESLQQQLTMATLQKKI